MRIRVLAWVVLAFAGVATAAPDFSALRRAVDDLSATHPGRYDGAAYRARIADLERRAAAGPDDPTLAADFTRLQREALLANPLLDFDRLLVLKRAFPKPAEARRAMGNAAGLGSLNATTSDTIPRQGHWRDALVVLSNLRGEIREEVLYAAPEGETLIEPDLDFDGRRILFAKNGAGQKNWRLWEIRADGSGLRQVSPDDGEDVGHFDPCWLPDGRIIFASTAVYQGLPCTFGGNIMVCLYQLDPASAAIRQLTFEQDSDWCPAVLPDGRVLYQRWEYNDLPHSNSRRLFGMNPDGTDQRAFYGSNGYFPNSFFYARPVPGHPRQVIGVAGGHHGTPRSGRLLILDPGLGRREAEGVVQEIPGWGRKVEPIVRDRLVDGVWPQFLMPMPLSPKYHLVTAKPRPDALWGLYLVDVFDNMVLLQEAEGAALFEPIVLQPRPAPPRVADRVDLERDTATVLLTDVYRGPGLAGIPRGEVKALRVVEYYFSLRGMGGLLGSIGMDGPWDVKRILGTVPVEEDGSAFFTIPANTPLMVQPLDADGQALQLMRSWFVGMPGEKVSCVGCHETANETPAPALARAARRAPSDLAPWHGPARGFSFAREVQPVLDARCARCHDGAQPGRPYLKGDRAIDDWRSDIAGNAGKRGGGKFSLAYAELHRFVRRPGIESDMRLLSPMDYHFSATELGQMLRLGHHGVRLEPDEWGRLAAWADLNAPFHGAWGPIVGTQAVARVAARALELRKQYVPTGPFPDYEAFPETSAPAGAAEATSAPAPAAPAVAAPPPVVAGWPFGPDEARRRQEAAAVGGRTEDVLDLGEGVTLRLVRVPGGTFVTGGEGGGTPPRAAEVAPFWLGRFEVRNAEFRRFDPRHDSRDESRHGYQFGRRGYDMNADDQPAVRVSWEQAQAFSAWLAQQTGRKVALPDETQWEWACRAGAATPFWFGGLDADYAKRANLGDRTLRAFAACTARQHYSAAEPLENPSKYDDWIPRDDRFDDGGLVTMPVGRYAPNPWGLCDLHGNAREWTASPFAPGSPERAARGGSWYDRPFRCTAAHRLAYRPYQRIFDVGFRIAVAD